MESKIIRKGIIYVSLTIIASIVSAIALHVFVYPSNFVPLGLEAIVTLLYSIFPNFNSGYINLILNAPLVILAIIKLHKKYVVYTVLFTITSSIFLIVLGAVNFPVYEPEDGRIISAIFAGVLLGVRTGIMLKMGSSTGGVDILACIIQKKKPYVNTERIITVLCIGIIGISYFVYKDFNCILLAIVQLFISEKTVSIIMRDNREAIEVKIITQNPDELYQDIVENLGHSATIVKSKGMYSKEENTIVFTIISRRQLPLFINLTQKYPNSFIYYTLVQGVYGKFRKDKYHDFENIKGEL